MLQLLAFQNPKITIANIQKVTTLRNSYQNRQPVLLAILWALGQGGMKDLQTGLKGWYFNLKFEQRHCVGRWWYMSCVEKKIMTILEVL